MKRALDLLQNVLAGLMTGLLVLFTVVVAYQVFSRYVGFIPRFIWTEEIARYSFVWMLFLGAAIAVRTGSHFTIDLLPTMSPRLSRLVDVTVASLMLAVALLILFGGVRFAQIGMNRVSTSSGLRLGYVYMALPVSGAAMVVFLLERLVNVLRGRSAVGDNPDAVSEVDIKHVPTPQREEDTA